MVHLQYFLRSQGYHLLQWVTVVLYSQEETLPLSRWGHTLVTADYSGGQGSGTSMMLFGGVNLKSFCEGSSLFEFCLDDKLCASAFEDTTRVIKQILSKPKDSKLSQMIAEGKPLDQKV